VIDLARAAFAQAEYRKTPVLEDSNVLARDALATELDYKTLFLNSADAVAFQADALALRPLGRADWILSVRTDQLPTTELGDCITVTHPRYGLSGGRNFIVKAIKRDLSSLYTQLTLYGPQ
jgi:hypothetical protein